MKLIHLVLLLFAVALCVLQYGGPMGTYEWPRANVRCFGVSHDGMGS